MLKDSFGRLHTYLRISLTEKCNLRCLYCMPEEGVQLSPPSHLLQRHEISRLSTVLVRHAGIKKIRLTGGEPSLRKDLTQIIADLSQFKDHPQGGGLQSIGMTSNGIALDRKLQELQRNGLDSLNISLDTLDPAKYSIITRRPMNGLLSVMRTVDKAMELNIPLKINCVVMKGVNDDELVQMVKFVRDKPITMRFIEFMPFGGNQFTADKLIRSQRIMQMLDDARLQLIRQFTDRSDTTRLYNIEGYRGRVGFISSMTNNFCSGCNRLRVTANGQLKVCLFGQSEINLRDIMRQNQSVDQTSSSSISSQQEDSILIDAIQAALDKKHFAHGGISDIETSKDANLNRPMILIGG
ncbi:hypothetical protein MP228_006236 [Amoeboaphelidium protococcarum]|nr:hypothetical protein MP228_006236 [Amoeboaphelidium protococcarum]